MKDNINNTIGTLLVGGASLLIIGGMGLRYADKRKHEQYMLSLPKEYFTAEAEKAKAESERRAKEYEAQRASELERYKARLEFEKSASPEYWAYKNAQEERDSRERISKRDAEAKKAQAYELRRAIESYTK